MKAARALFAAFVAAASLSPARGTEPTLQSLEATRERPLFSPSRRPPPPPPPPPIEMPAPPVAAPSPPPDVELTGVILGPSEQQAILKRPDEPEPQSVRVGADIDGWKITSISARSIVLTRADKSIEIKLPAHELEGISNGGRD